MSIQSHYDKEIHHLLTPIQPQDILHICEKPRDYICGVADGMRICRRSIYCSKHLFGERALVERSKSLSKLILDELKDSDRFRKLHWLGIAFHSCRAYYTSQEPEGLARPCSKSSSNESKSDNNVISSPFGRPNTVQEKLSYHTARKFKLIKSLFLSKLSRSAAKKVEDVVSYLHYKLECYEDVELDVRAREMQVKYHERGSST